METEFNPATATLEESTAVLGRDETRLLAAEQAVSAAREQYQRELRRPHADLTEVRERIEAQFGSAVRVAENEAVELSRVVSERARGIMAAATTPSLKLSAGETVEAGGFAPFAEADCRDLRISDLASAVRAAVVSGDRARMFAYRQYLPKRLAGIGPESEAPSRGELARLQGTIKERLADPAFAIAHARAYAVAEKARELAQPIERQRMQSDLAAGKVRFGFQSDGDVPWNQE